MESLIPTEMKNKEPELIALDSVIGGYCSQMLKNSSKVMLLKTPILSADEKKKFSSLLNEASAEEKDKLVIYYRLIILVESVILQYI